MDTGDFLKELYEKKPGNHNILIWTKNHHSEWFTKIEEAAAYVKSNPDDVYFGVGTSEKNFGGSKRCPKSQISGIPGFWADIDIHAEGAHKGKMYPKDMAEAMSLVKVPEMEPTLVVHSGYGLHCYWLFDEYWSFDGPLDRKQAADLEQRMNVTIQNRAAAVGVTVDSVFDLSRILRPVGSMNCKQTKKEKVKLIENSGKRYSPINLISLLDPIPEEKQKKVTKKHVVLDSRVEINLDATVPASRLFELSSVYENFPATWSNDRGGKWSPSEYDLSLANMAIGVGWSEQETIDLIIHSRRENDTLDVKKMKRRDYLEGTIRLAIENSKKNEFESLANKLALGETDKNEVVKKINSLLSPLLKFVQLDLQIDMPNYDYSLTLEKKDGTREKFKLQGELQSKLLFIKNVQNATDVRLSLTQKQWDTLSQAFSIVKITHRKTTTEQQVKESIEKYLEKFESCKNSQLDELWDAGKPFKRAGIWYVQAEHMFRWHLINNHESDKSFRTFRNELADCGFEDKRPKYSEQQPDGTIKVRQKRMMEVPKGYTIP